VNTPHLAPLIGCRLAVAVGVGISVAAGISQQSGD